MPVVFGAVSLMNIGPKAFRHGVRPELPVNEELHFDPIPGPGFINDPTRHRLAVGLVQNSAQMSIRGGEIKAHRDRRDQQGLGHGL